MLLIVHRVRCKELQRLLIFGLGQWWTNCNLVFHLILALEVFPLHVHSRVISAGAELKVRSVLQVVHDRK